jgi:hypothetical protein
MTAMDEKEFAATEQAYKEWLRQQAMNDDRDRAMGIPPLPRSREERDAIYYNLPRGERQRIPKRLRP